MAAFGREAMRRTAEWKWSAFVRTIAKDANRPAAARCAQTGQEVREVIESDANEQGSGSREYPFALAPWLADAIRRRDAGRKARR